MNYIIYDNILILYSNIPDNTIDIRKQFVS